MHPLGKQRISVTIAADLLDEVDRYTENRSAAVEEGLRLWYKQQVEGQLRAFYQQQSTEGKEQDEQWADFAQGEMEAIVETTND